MAGDRDAGMSSAGRFGCDRKKYFIDVVDGDDVEALRGEEQCVSSLAGAELEHGTDGFSP